MGVCTRSDSKSTLSVPEDMHFPKTRLVLIYYSGYILSSERGAAELAAMDDQRLSRAMGYISISLVLRGQDSSEFGYRPHMADRLLIMPSSRDCSSPSGDVGCWVVD
ncbi:hypothetical protein E1301_Tti001050 [Triplophysa tibetana]|uniref:Uncharacterized protein n=1 Tax=Triplophysa tibetana TaxID=1572043 RepID=A0A5A9N655_9TELE|nr:hypothetical protein E1301_Tti001050 [Triplophysa tibetana]